MNKKMILLTVIVIFSGLVTAEEITQPQISVYGTAEIKVIPNEMIWSLNVNTKDKDLVAVARKQMFAVEQALGFLKEMDIEARILKEIDIEARKLKEMDTEANKLKEMDTEAWKLQEMNTEALKEMDMEAKKLKKIDTKARKLKEMNMEAQTLKEWIWKQLNGY